MPRSPRLHVPGAFYHVTLRGNHRQNIFYCPADRTLLDEITAEVIERFTARLHAYCWMTNHVHLLIQVSDTPLAKLMLRIAGRYARTVQKRLKTTGHLFEKRYHAVVVDADDYLLELVRYIHLNPVRARMVTDPAAHPWSSHSVYLGKRSQPWITTDFALSMFHPQRDRAVAAYARFIGEATDHPATSPLAECNPSDSRILGSDDFAARLLGEAWRPRSRKTLGDLIAEAVDEFSVTEEALRSSSCERRLTKARAWVAYQATTLRITSVSEVARHFNRTEAALRHGVKRHFSGT